MVFLCRGTVARAMAWTDGLRERAPRVHKFLTRHDKPYPAVRELLVGALVILLLLGGLYTLTGQPFKGGYPVVVVTSGSMMHCTNAGTQGAQLGRTCDPTIYGRLGSIDPGDLVFVRHVNSPDDVTTLAQSGGTHYGRSGDVIVYRPFGSTTLTPIIHRALFWLQAESDNTYSIPQLGLSHVDSLDQKVVTDLTHCALAPPPKSSDPHASLIHSGFITKGDNNGAADQCPSGTISTTVRLEWVLGKARGELPWIGLIKLEVDDLTSHSTNFHDAGGDSKVMLFVSLAVLIGAPWGYDLYRRRRAMRVEKN